MSIKELLKTSALAALAALVIGGCSVDADDDGAVVAPGDDDTTVVNPPDNDTTVVTPPSGTTTTTTGG